MVKEIIKQYNIYIYIYRERERERERDMKRIKTKYHNKKKGVKCVYDFLFFFHNVYAHYKPILFYLK